MSRDYFTRAEFRTFAGDPGGGTPTYSDANIDAAQAEVIEALEEWAMSAWPNVTGTDGDGTAAARRTTTETFDGGDSRFFLGHLPVYAVTSMKIDDVELDSDSYFKYLPEGYVRTLNAIGSLPRGVVIAYSYGFTSTPFSIKRAAMQATKSLLDQKSGKAKKIPPNTTRWSTETATFEFDTDKDIDRRPWPWDMDASGIVQSYWGSSRPLTVGAV